MYNISSGIWGGWEGAAYSVPPAAPDPKLAAIFSLANMTRFEIIMGCSPNIMGFQYDLISTQKPVAAHALAAPTM